MRRIIYTLALGAVMAVTLMLTPVISRAQDGDNNDDDNTYFGQRQENHDPVVEWFKARDIHGRTHWMERGMVDPFTHRPLGSPRLPGDPGNSVPLDEGTIFLLIAGLGLGAKILYDRRKSLRTV